MIPAEQLLAGIGTILTAVVVAGIKKVWVWGYQLTDKDDDLAEMTVDRNFWRDTALKAMGHTDKALDVAGKKDA